MCLFLSQWKTSLDHSVINFKRKCLGKSVKIHFRMNPTIFRQIFKTPALVWWLEQRTRVIKLIIIEFTVRWKYGSIQPVKPRNGSDISTAELYPEWIFIQLDELASRFHLWQWSEASRRHDYHQNAVQPVRLFVIQHTETFSLHLIQYSIKPPKYRRHLVWANASVHPWFMPFLELSIPDASIQFECELKSHRFTMCTLHTS